VDSVLLFVAVASGAALILAGAYGLAPSLLPRRRRAESQLVAARLAGADASGQAAPAPASTATAVVAGEDKESTPIEVASPQQPKATGFDPLLGDAAWASDEADGDLLDEMMAEIEMLRSQVRRLRAELEGLRARTTARARPARSNDRHSPRRLRPQARVDLPPPLRRQLSSIRSGRLRSAV
jgi:hypothetical protein